MIFRHLASVCIESNVNIIITINKNEWNFIILHGVRLSKNVKERPQNRKKSRSALPFSAYISVEKSSST